MKKLFVVALFLAGVLTAPAAIQTLTIEYQQGDTTLEGVVLAGDTSAEGWLKTLLQEELPAQTYGRLLLVPGAKAPVAVQSRGKSVCTCFNVTDAAITAELAHCHGTDDDRLAQLQGKLRCGTNCGSCLPELKRMVRATGPLATKPMAQAAI